MRYVMMLTLVGLFCSACNKPATPAKSSSKAAPPAEEYFHWQGGVGGVYELPIPTQPADAQYRLSRERLETYLEGRNMRSPDNPAPDGMNLDWRTSELTFSVKGGKLTLNGKKYGEITSGDKVRVTRDGQVIVNGQRRQEQK